MNDFVSILAGGDRRSIGQSKAVIAAVKLEPARFEELWDCLSNDDPLVRMRVADALEKISRQDFRVLKPYKKALLTHALDDDTPEVRWHLIAMTSRLPLQDGEASKVMRYLKRAQRDDASRIVKVMALQAGFDLTSQHPSLAISLRAMLDQALNSRWPSVRARARKLSRSVCSRAETG